MSGQCPVLSRKCHVLSWFCRLLSQGIWSALACRGRGLGWLEQIICIHCQLQDSGGRPKITHRLTLTLKGLERYRQWRIVIRQGLGEFLASAIVSCAKTPSPPAFARAGSKPLPEGTGTSPEARSPCWAGPMWPRTGTGAPLKRVGLAAADGDDLAGDAGSAAGGEEGDGRRLKHTGMALNPGCRVGS